MLMNKTKLYNIILDLKIISKIKPCNKLIIDDNKLLIDDSYYLSPLLRYYKNQNRFDTFNYIEKLNNNLELEINNIILNNEKVEHIIKENVSNILIKLSYDLNQAINGLKNLIFTYHNDNFLVCKIEMIICNFELIIKKISEKFQSN